MFGWLLGMIGGARPASDGSSTGEAVEPLAKPDAAEEKADPLDTYVQEVLERLYDAEAEKNESIWRTTPFFVTSFGFIAAALGFLVSKAPSLTPSVWSGLVYLLLAGVATLAGIAFWWLFEMLRERTYAYLLDGGEMRDHAEALKRFYLKSGSSEQESSVCAVADLRTDVIKQLALAAAVGRESNKRRTRARSLAVYFLMLATALAFFTSSLILLEEKMPSAARTGGSDDGRRTFKEESSSEPSPASAGAPDSNTAGVRAGGRGSSVSDKDEQSLTQPPPSKQRVFAYPGT